MFIDPEVSRLAAAMRDVDQLLEHLEPIDDGLLGNALLNLAIMRMIDADGARCTAGVLTRLAHAIVNGPAPSARRGVDLFSLHS